MQEPGLREKRWKMLSSGHDTATANTRAQQLLLLAVGLNQTETVNSPSWTEGADALPLLAKLLAIDAIFEDGQSLSSGVYPVDETIKLQWTVSNPWCHK